MKTFFTAFGGAIIGTILGAVLLAFLAAAMIGGFVNSQLSSFQSDGSASGNTVLTLDLRDELSDQPATQGLGAIFGSLLLANISRPEALLRAWPAAVLVALVVGGIYTGVFTATEAAAVSMVFVVGFGFLSRRLSLAAFLDSARETAVQSAALFFIAVGATLLNLFSFMFLVFGLLLLWTAVQLYRHKDEDPDIEDNLVVKGARRLFPVTEEYDGGKLFTRDNGRRVATPMFIVLVSIGGIDLLFALDSIPAVFGVTQEAFIVFTANAFALLGLRALFFLVKGLLDRLVYLSTGLAVILGFIGVKLVLHWAHVDINPAVPEIPTMASLVVILGILAVVTVASLIKTRNDPSMTAHAGSLRARKERSDRD